MRETEGQSVCKRSNTKATALLCFPFDSGVAIVSSTVSVLSLSHLEAVDGSVNGKGHLLSGVATDNRDLVLLQIAWAKLNAQWHTLLAHSNTLTCNNNASEW